MRIIVAVTAILFLSAYQASAKTINFPEHGTTMFQITIPDSWEPDTDADEVVEATSPKEHVSLAIWEIKSQEDLDNLGTDIEDLLSDHAKDLKLKGKPKAIAPAGMEGLLFEGTAVDEEDDDKKIQFFALFLINKEAKKVAVVFIEADSETPRKEVDKLVGILNSIKQPN